MEDVFVSRKRRAEEMGSQDDAPRELATILIVTGRGSGELQSGRVVLQEQVW